jgi:hypothetical protein
MASIAYWKTKQGELSIVCETQRVSKYGGTSHWYVECDVVRMPLTPELQNIVELIVNNDK